MGRQLGWVWFGGEKYKIAVFYLTNDNSVFCRENDDDPVLLVSQLPKRINLGFSGSFEFGNGTAYSNLPRFGYDIVDGLENNDNIGNSLDDLREVVQRVPDGYPVISQEIGTYDASAYRRSSIEAYASVAGTPPINFGGYSILYFFRAVIRPENTVSSYFNLYVMLQENNSQDDFNFSGFRGIDVLLDRSLNEIATVGNAGAGVFLNFSIPSISNAYGFMARVLPSKTIFAITDQAGFADFPAYRGRITTGTISAFTTHQLPTVPTLDLDMFIENDEIPSGQKAPYSIVQAHRSINFYDNSNKTICLTEGDVIENTALITNRLISNSSVTIQVFDGAIHQNNSQAIPKQIPGLPANTKAVLGVLACPV